MIFQENWETGSIDTTVWRKWGTPSAFIANEGFNSSHSLDPNGDGNYNSGVVTNAQYSISGTVLEFDANITGTATHHQAAMVGFGKNDGSSSKNNTSYIQTRINGDYNSVDVVYTAFHQALVEYDIGTGWHHYRIEVSTSGHVKFYRDGFATFELPYPISLGVFPQLYLNIQGRSVYHPVYIDNIELSQDSSGINPGDSCGTGKVYDCELNCVDQATAQSWIGDGYCDDENSPYGYVLTCPEFNNDGGDCGNIPGTSCGEGVVYDCVGNCVDETKAQSWIGDNYCDDGTWGMDLWCPAFSNDGGDCGS
jgi:hypothetical protein